MRRRNVILLALLFSVAISGCSSEKEKNTENSEYVQEESATEEKTTEETTTVTLESLNINPHDIMEYIGEAPEGVDSAPYITEYEVIQTEPFILKVRNHDAEYTDYEILNTYSYFSLEGFLYKYNDVWYQQIVNLDNIKKADFYDADVNNNYALQILGESSDGRYTYKGAVSVVEEAGDFTPDMNNFHPESSDCQTFEIIKNNRKYYFGLIYNAEDTKENRGKSLEILGYTYIEGDTAITMHFGLKSTGGDIFSNPEEFANEEFLSNLMDVKIYE